ncbi:MAG: deoxynucleoside kinase [Chloroflexota bacterium]
MSKHFVLVAGNIGAGKTSLTERVGARLDWQTGYETVGENPYLADFYEDMSQWAFHLQVFLLGQRANLHEHLATITTSAISDRSIYEDATIFARGARKLGTISERDYEAYRTVYLRVIDSLPKPDLLVHLKAPIPTLLERIAKRGREMEKGITADYLSLLESYYDDWIHTFDLCPILTIETENLDFVTRPEHLEIVVKGIQDRLMGHDVIVLT